MNCRGGHARHRLLAAGQGVRLRRRARAHSWGAGQARQQPERV